MDDANHWVCTLHPAGDRSDASAILVVAQNKSSRAGAPERLTRQSRCVPGSAGRRCSPYLFSPPQRKGLGIRRAGCSWQ
jgi:hypothetical protein